MVRTVDRSSNRALQSWWAGVLALAFWRLDDQRKRFALRWPYLPGIGSGMPTLRNCARSRDCLSTETSLRRPTGLRRGAPTPPPV